jgi:thymidylate synthase (FAD)
VKVTLVAHTPDPLMVVGRAANTCYSADGGEISREKAEHIIEKCVRSGHHSVLEHASFTFEIEGVSRALSHQLVRHRIASYSQQSQRYVKMGDPSYVTPPSILKEDDYSDYKRTIYESVMNKCWDTYKELVSVGVPPEDARMVLPNACTTRITVTMNTRALFNFFAHRLCNKAQWEIREMAALMYQEVVKVFPETFEFAGPPCYTDHCHEADPCGKEVMFGPKTMEKANE